MCAAWTATSGVLRCFGSTDEQKQKQSPLMARQAATWSTASLRDKSPQMLAQQLSLVRRDVH